jgi:hypothetical protein
VVEEHLLAYETCVRYNFDDVKVAGSKIMHLEKF